MTEERDRQLLSCSPNSKLVTDAFDFAVDKINLKHVFYQFFCTTQSPPTFFNVLQDWLAS
jgi:hypothetical protein